MDDRYGGRGGSSHHHHYDEYGDSDSYRPSYRSSYQDTDSSHPQSSQAHSSYAPPLPSGPPPSLAHQSNMYHFGQHQNGFDNRNGAQFNFRSNGSLPSYPDQDGSRYREYRDRDRDYHDYPGYDSRDYGRHYGDRRDYRQRDYDSRDTRQTDREEYYRSNQGRRNMRQNGRSEISRTERRIAANRPLLNRIHGRSPLGPDNAQTSDSDIPKFRNPETMSDSDSVAMSESDGGEKSSTKVQQPTAPKWSNPEAFESLPLNDGSTKRKNKDLVKFIRKARLEASTAGNETKELAKNDDWVALVEAARASLQPENATSTEAQRPVKAPVSILAKIANPAMADQGPIDPTDPGSAVLGVSVEDQQPVQSFTPIGFLPETSTNRIAQPAQTFTPSGFASGTAMNRVPEPVLNSIANRLPAQKRKRSNVDDQEESESTPMPVFKKSRKSQRLPNGDILPEWISKDKSTSTPWMDDCKALSIDCADQLHKQILSFYNFVKPLDFEQIMRLDLLNRVRENIKTKHPDCEIHAFGSFAASIYLPDADIDLVVVSKPFTNHGDAYMNRPHRLRNVADWLIRDGLADHYSTETILSAKVPLVKFRDTYTGIRVDMSFENLTGPRAVATFNDWKVRFPAMPIIVTMIKQFLLMRGLNEVVNGGLGGFSVTCLVVAALQNMPRVLSGEVIPEDNLGEILLEFLDLYGNKFDLSTMAIQLNPAGFVRKSFVGRTGRDKDDRLHIVDPNDSSNDISGGSRNVKAIFQLFSQIHKELLDAMGKNGARNLLGPMLGGDYSMYTARRQIMRRLYDSGRWTPASFSQEEELLDALQQQTRNFQGRAPKPLPRPPRMKKKAVRRVGPNNKSQKKSVV